MKKCSVSAAVIHGCRLVIRIPFSSDLGSDGLGRLAQYREELQVLYGVLLLWKLLIQRDVQGENQWSHFVPDRTLRGTRTYHTGTSSVRV